MICAFKVRYIKGFVSLVFLFLCGFFRAYDADAQQLHATFKDWSVFTVIQNDKKICYIASVPVKKNGNYRKRGEPYFLVTRVADGVDEVSTSSGYKYKDKGDVKLNIGKKRYGLFVYEDVAWAKNRSDDKAIIDDMIKGRNMIVKGVSTLGTYSNDTYSLLGITDAYNKMKDLCK